MSGLETLGALASTAQIALYVVKAAAFLSEICERVKHAPDRIRHQAHHIQNLLEIVRHIQHSNLQNYTALLTQLKSTISQACNLRDLLGKVLGQYTDPSLRSRYWKLLKGSKEKQILAALQSLEREKTALTLCLAASNAEVLEGVRRDLGMGERKTRVQQGHNIPTRPLSPTLFTAGDEDAPNALTELADDAADEALDEEKQSNSTTNMEDGTTVNLPPRDRNMSDESKCPNIAVGEQVRSHSGRTNKKAAALTHSITNSDMVCNGGFQHGGIAGRLPQEGSHAFKIENMRGKTTGDGVANWGIVLEGGENLFNKFVSSK